MIQMNLKFSQLIVILEIKQFVRCLIFYNHIIFYFV